MKMILAHCARGFNMYHTIEAIGSLAGLENVYFDTGAICEAGAIHACIKAFGSKRVMYGSDVRGDLSSATRLPPPSPPLLPPPLLLLLLLLLLRLRRLLLLLLRLRRLRLRLRARVAHIAVQPQTYPQELPLPFLNFLQTVKTASAPSRNAERRLRSPLQKKLCPVVVLAAAQRDQRFVG